MKKTKSIHVFEHQRLRVGQQGFTQKHLDALGKLNEYHEGAYFEMISKGVKFRQFVGIIQVEGLTIEIHPKADKYGEPDKWRSVLIQMLKACGRIKAQSTGVANVSRQNLNLLEIYFELYLFEVAKLIRGGLIKQYRKESKNVTALKGKLEFAQNISRNMVHKERFYTTHQVYDTDHLLHQVLTVALEIVAHYTRGTRLFDHCKRVQLEFPETSVKQITSSHLDKIKWNRKNAPYKYAIELARLIILNYSPDIKGGRERMLSLLFDMNQLWEEYVLVQLRKHIKKERLNIEIAGQKSKVFWGSNSLRPDIVLRAKSETYIIDTKWKVPGTSTASVGDLRQMYTYNRFWDAPKAMLLYPGGLRDSKWKSFETDDYYLHSSECPKEIDHQCKMSFVDVVNDDGQLLDIGKQVLTELRIPGIE